MMTASALSHGHDEDLFAPIVAQMAALGLTPRDVNFLLAVSGGADSMAMAIMMQEWWQSTPQRKALSALVIDHGIRPESASEAAATAERLIAIGIPTLVERISSPAPKTALQSWARENRYQLLCNAARQNNAVVVTGHHADDQAETVQMRLSRGSGLYGLAGMGIIQHHQGVMIARPFLQMPMKNLRNTAKAQGLITIDDASNRNVKFERARLRRDALALQEQGITSNDFLRLSAVSARIVDKLENRLKPLMDDAVIVDDHGWAKLDLSILNNQSKAAQSHILRKITGLINAAAYAPNEDALGRLGEWLFASKTQENKGHTKTLGGLEWWLKGDKAFVYPEAERLPEPLDIEAGTSLFDRRWLITTPLGGRLSSLGANRAAQLRRTHPEFFKNHDAPARAYWRWPVLMPKDPHGDPQEIEKITQDGWFALEDGAFIPHLEDRQFSVNHDQFTSLLKDALSMRLIRRDGFAAQDEHMERQNP